MSQSAAFPAFQKAFTGDLVTKDDDEYAKAIGRWARNASKQADIVAYPKTEQDIILALEFVKDQKLDLAVKGGGHNPSGASSVLGGLVIDLARYFASVTVDTTHEHPVAIVGGGSTWALVDKELYKHGFATTGGTVNSTGVGGLTLGGGYGWLVGTSGMAIDNVVGARIINAKGEILNLSESDNSDLFWAIRGGGGNFGIVTSLTYKVYSQGSVWAGLLIFPPPVLGEIVKVIDTWQNESEEVGFLGSRDGLFLLIGGTPHGPMVICQVFHNGTPEEGKARFKAFLDLGPVHDTTAAIPYPVLNTLASDVLLPGKCYYMRATAQAEDDPDKMPRALEKVSAIVGTKGFENSCVIFEYQPVKKAAAVPVDSMAYPVRKEIRNVLTLMTWEEDDKGMLDQARVLARDLGKVFEEGKGAKANYYSNYESDPGFASENPLRRAETYFGDHYPRLQKIKGQNDPNNIFNKWFSIDPAFA